MKAEADIMRVKRCVIGTTMTGIYITQYGDSITIR